MNSKRAQIVTFSLFIISLFCFVLMLNIGSVHISLADIFNNMSVNAHNWQSEVLWQLRLPRIIAAFVSGGMLALSGCLLQVLLRNPLADPYILGISGGAAFFNLCGLMLGVSYQYSHLMAFAGALLSMIIVYCAGFKQQHTHQQLLLCGVMIAASWGALISCCLSLTNSNNLHTLFFWLMGDLSAAQWPLISILILVLGLVLSLLLAKSLNVLSGGELRARTLGVNCRRLQLKLYFISAMLTACAVTIAGPIGFVGLVVPHLLRLLGIRDHYFLLPSSVLLGGTLLMIADSLARSLFAPEALPVGIITTLIGVPVFLILLKRNVTQ